MITVVTAVIAGQPAKIVAPIFAQHVAAHQPSLAERTLVILGIGGGLTFLVISGGTLASSANNGSGPAFTALAMFVGLATVGAAFLPWSSTTTRRSALEREQQRVQQAYQQGRESLPERGADVPGMAISVVAAVRRTPGHRPRPPAPPAHRRVAASVRAGDPRRDGRRTTGRRDGMAPRQPVAGRHTQNRAVRHAHPSAIERAVGSNFGKQDWPARLKTTLGEHFAPCTWPERYLVGVQR